MYMYMYMYTLHIDIYNVHVVVHTIRVYNMYNVYFSVCVCVSQVRERWVNHLDERISKLEWSSEEDEKLKSICQRYSGTAVDLKSHC